MQRYFESFVQFIYGVKHVNHTIKSFSLSLEQHFLDCRQSTNTFCSSRTGFNRQAEGTSLNTNQQRVNGSPNPSPIAFSPTMPPLAQSSPFASNTGSFSEDNAGSSNPESQVAAEPPKYFFREKYAKLGVKGNFMPLAARPTNVSLPDWLAHQSWLPEKSVSESGVVY